MNPPRQQPEDLREELIQASLDILREPDTGLDVREVCRRVNRSQTAAYTVFGKEKEGGGFTALLAAAATRGFENLGDRLGAAWSENGEDPSAGLEAICHAYMDFARQERGLYRVMFGEKLMSWSDAQHEEPSRAEFAMLIEARSQVQTFLTLAIADAREAGVVSGRSDLEHALYAWASLHGLVELALAKQFALLFSATGINRFLDNSIHHLIISMRERN